MRFLLATVLVLALGNTSAVASRPKSLLESLYVPAPPKASLIYEDTLENAGLPMMAGAYANTDTMTVHALRGQGGLDNYSAGHELGHLFSKQILSDGDRRYFSRLLGTDPTRWENLTGADQPEIVAGDEAFADYYSAAAAGFNPRRDSYARYVNVDPRTYRKFSAALGRLGRRHDLGRLDLKSFLASAR